MRAREVRCLITFSTITHAIALEAACRSADLPGRLIPLPGHVSAGCGMAWSAPPETQAELERLIAASALSAERCCLITI